jgi:hypothetical protein
MAQNSKTIMNDDPEGMWKQAISACLQGGPLCNHSPEDADESHVSFRYMILGLGNDTLKLQTLTASNGRIFINNKYAKMWDVEVRTYLKKV